jgi:putative PIN family toxin of toxin-antitoxin system
VLRAVLDPGVLIAGLISAKGAPREIIYRWLEGDFELVVSERVLEEVRRVLLGPKFRHYVTEQDAIEYVRLLRRFGNFTADPVEVPRVAPDPGEDYLFTLAESAGVRLLVSGDRALSGLSRGIVQVVTPRAFLNLTRRGTTPGGGSGGT